jgi:hypothetical protein
MRRRACWLTATLGRAADAKSDFRSKTLFRLRGSASTRRRKALDWGGVLAARRVYAGSSPRKVGNGIGVPSSVTAKFRSAQCLPLDKGSRPGYAPVRRPTGRSNERRLVNSSMISVATHQNRHRTSQEQYPPSCCRSFF